MKIDYKARYFVFENKQGEQIVVDRWDHLKKYKRMARAFINYTSFNGPYYYKHITLTQKQEFYKPNILNSFFVRLRRRYGDIAYIWTAELQQRRYKKYDEAVLHWHIIVGFPYGTDIDVTEIQRLQRYWSYGNLDVRSIGRLNLNYVLKYITKSLDGVLDLPYKIKKISMSLIPQLYRHCKSNILKAIEWAGYNLDRLFDFYRVDKKGVYYRYWDDVWQKWRKDYMLVLSSWRLVASYDGEPF